MTSQILCNVLWQVPNWQRGLLSGDQLHQMAQLHSYGQSERSQRFISQGRELGCDEDLVSLSAVLLPVATTPHGGIDVANGVYGRRHMLYVPCLKLFWR